jgi:hypothetical protein
MKRIFKYKLHITDRQELQLPVKADIIKCAYVNSDLYIWAIIEDQHDTESIDFSVYGTGDPLPDNPGIYIDTVILHEGRLVFHVFRLPNPSNQVADK